MYDSYMFEVAVSEARNRLAEVIEESTRSGEPVSVTRRGRRVAVIIDPDSYDELVDAAEDALDRHELELARAENDFIPWAEVKADLGLERARTTSRFLAGPHRPSGGCPARSSVGCRRRLSSLPVSPDRRGASRCPGRRRSTGCGLEATESSMKSSTGGWWCWSCALDTVATSTGRVEVEADDWSPRIVSTRRRRSVA